MDALINLLMQCLNYSANKSNNERLYLINPDCFECLWHLYFDPLLVRCVFEGNELVRKGAIGKESYQSSTQQRIRIKWTDSREDEYSDGNITRRQRVNMIVHEALNACKNKEQLLSLLVKMQLDRLDATHILEHWMNLLSHLMSIKYTHMEIVELLFDRLKDVNIVSFPEGLSTLILDLLKLLPKFNNDNQINYVGNQIVQMIQKFILSDANRKTQFAEESMRRIYASTCVNNVQGHDIFFFLLKDLIPFYDKNNQVELIKTVDRTLILWYANYILQNESQSQPMTEYCQTLLTILQYVTKYTEQNYLGEWFQWISNFPNDVFIFQMITYSIYPRSTLATYIRHINREQIIEFLKCIHLPIASKFTSGLLTIIEELINNTQARVILFQSDEFHQILEHWLLSETSSLIVIRFVALLLNVATSENNPHAMKIAEFFGDKFASKFFSINFDGQSPFASIILFLLYTSNTNATNAMSIGEKIEHFLKDLFIHINESSDTDDQNMNNTFSLHLLSISNCNIEEQLQIKYSKLLSLFIPDLIALLNQSNQLKYASVKLLGNILDLSDDERSLLAENFQYGSIHDDLTEQTSQTTHHHQQQQQQQQNVFFSTEVGKRLEISRVRNTDFISAHEFLQELEGTKQQQLVDEKLRKRLSKQRSDRRNLPVDDEQTNYLILTDTTRENIFKILEVVDDPVPILLEGSTGVGKSATVMEAFWQICSNESRTFLRFNMSSHVTIDDLIGKVMLVFDKGMHMTNFQFIPGPFTRAFGHGHWILFDELNLAQDTVLQAIESALDTRQLTINKNSSVQDAKVTYKMHEDFRLFATQNPSTGFFRNKREKLSSSFLSRFRPLIFSELPNSEWCYIVQQRLKPYLETEAEHYADLLVNSFHMKVKEMLNDSGKGPIETGPYAEMSIRELLKWVNQLIWRKQNRCWPTNPDRRKTMLSFSAWCIYGARYRDHGRTMIENFLTDNSKGGWDRPALQEIKMHVDQGTNTLFLDDIQCSPHFTVRTITNPQSEWSRNFTMADRKTIPFNSNAWTIASKVHYAVYETLMDVDFIHSHGIYRIDHSWLWQWFASAVDILDQRNKFAIYGCQLYTSRFRHVQAQNKVRACFMNYFENVDLHKITPESMMAQLDIPFILTDRVLSTLKQVSFDMNIRQPILLTGPEGCGKSDLLLALGWLNGQQISQLNITPETEPSAFIGQIVPCETKDSTSANYGKMLDWENGCVTHAYINGQWAVLDNFNTAEASVLERLNPILEEKPMLILTENGEIHEQKMHDDYRLFATMAPPDSNYSVSNTNELSPSLYNRFAIVHMQDIDKDSGELFQLAKGLLADDVDVQLAVDLCREILKFLSNNMPKTLRLTLRNFVRFFDSTYRLHQIFGRNQIKGGQMKNQMTKFIEEFFHRLRPNCKLCQLPFTNWIEQTDEHILTATRLNYANAILGAVACNIPLLLEGPAAVGKTTLITHLCKNLNHKSMSHTKIEYEIKLERVNNTDTTTIQDYLGTYLPMNNGFVFQKGALYRAMENGWWFLADEFNLADPWVMNILFPLLEGKNSIIIPASGKTITAKPGFHFFATQNDASYANRHQLPISLRNRFLEIQFDEFPESELAEILLRRKQSSRQQQKYLSRQLTKSLASLYHLLIKKRSRITFRELIKWIRRYDLLSGETEVWPMIGVSLLAGKYPLESSAREELMEVLKTKWPNAIIQKPSQIEIKQDGGELVRFQENDLRVNIKTTALSQNAISTWPSTFKHVMVRIAQAIHSHEPILLVGPTSCKTLLVETWARILDRSDELSIIHLTPESESANLIGEIQPYTFLDLLKRLPSMAERVVRRFRVLCQNQNLSGRLNSNDKEFIKHTMSLMTKDLNDAIDHFEKEYTHEKESDEQRDAYQNNFDSQTDYAESFLLPSLSPDSIGTIESIPETKTSTIESPRHHKDYEHSPRVYSYYDDDEENNISKMNKYDMTSYEDYDVTSDDSSDRDSIKTLSNMRTNIKDDPSYESNRSARQTTTDEQYDDYESVSDSEESKSTTTDPRNSLESTTSTDENSSLFVNSAPPTTMTESQFESLPMRLNNQTELSFKLYETVKSIQRAFDKMIRNANYAPFTATDNTLLDSQSKFDDAWQRLSDENTDRSKPIFSFNDGPVITAAKRGGILFLEDLDLPSQAVIERLNSMLEPDSTLTLTEDVTALSDKGQLEISLSKDFQIFATVHQEHPYESLKLSPSTRSRFTEIYVPAYSNNELEDLVKYELNRFNSKSNEIALLVRQMFSLREKLRTDPEWKLQNDIQLLFRWVDFIKNHHASISLTYRMLLGARFHYFELLSSSRHSDIFEEWLNSLENPRSLHEYRFIFKQPDESHGAITFESIQSNQRVFPFEVDRDYITLRYTGVRYSCKDEKDPNETLNRLRHDFFCVPTPTLINQIARIFAATSSKTPLLLEGPPGTGKTQVVTQVCSLLGKECERINLSANTSLDQLIGCIIPRFVNGVRVFQWQEGRVLSAIRAQRWILFDELNLAAPEVLEELSPLFYRGISHYTIKSTGERVPINDVLIFATMNPSTIGGGRSKLPSSINNLFTIVHVDDYTDDELRIILNQLFLYDLEKKNIDMTQLDQLFDTHVSFKACIGEGVLGRTGGPYKLNLRDLSKFRDVFRHSIDNQMSHYEFLNTIIDENTNNEDHNVESSKKLIKEVNSSVDVSTARQLSITKFAQVVYACQFQGEKDFIEACKRIDDKFRVNKKIEEKSCSIDTSSATVVRIGSIYIKSGSEEPSTAVPSLIHTRKTIRQLESLAAACQSKRTILLEGDVCSRKTSLVIELARITRHRLIIIPLHENYETSDLIGSWLPGTEQKRDTLLLNKIETLFKDIIKLILLFVMPSINEQRYKTELEEFQNILRLRTSYTTLTRDEVYGNEISVLKRTINVLNNFCNVSDDKTRIYISCYIQRAMNYRNKLKEFQSNTKQEIGFTFVESEFVQAIREGWWVLFDNINSAPPEVLERLNSLTEDHPMLSLYEYSDGQILIQNDNPIIAHYKNSEGKISTEKFGIIHENFRLFTTANLNRIYSNKLSSAFLNRVIRIWLPSIDDCDETDPLKSDLYELLSTQLISIPAGKQLAHLLLLIHIRIKQYAKAGQLVYPADFQICYRLLEQCVRRFMCLIKKNIHPVDACYASIIRSYFSALCKYKDYEYVLKQLQKLIEELNLCSASMSFSSPANEFNEKQERHIQEEKVIRSEFVEFEQLFIEYILNIFKILFKDENNIKKTQNLFVLFLNGILLPMTPNNTQLIQVKETLITESETEINFLSLLDEIGRQRQIQFENFNVTLSQAIVSLNQKALLSMRAVSEQLCSLLDNYISNTSFNDAKQRLEFLKQAIQVIEIFHNFFSSTAFDDLDKTIKIKELCTTTLQLLQPLLTLKDRLVSFNMLTDTEFLHIKQQYLQDTSDDYSINISLIKSFDRIQSFPIRSTRNPMRKLVERFIKGVNKDSAIMKTIQHYAPLLEWIRIRWIFDDYLMNSVRDVLQKKIPINRHFINECELKLSCSQLIKRILEAIQNAIQNLPSETSKLKEEYSAKEIALKSITNKISNVQHELGLVNNRLNNSRDRHRNFTDENELDDNAALRRYDDVFRSEHHECEAEKVTLEKKLNRLHDQSSQITNEFKRIQESYHKTLDKAIEAKRKFEQDMKDIFESDSYRFIHHYFEESDANGLSRLVESLFQCRSSQNLINMDGSLDVRGILETQVGRELITYENILRSPLIFFICGFFFLPNFDHHLQILIISRWEQIQDNKINIGTLNKNTFLFYCPNQNQYDCALVKFTNEPKQVLVKVLSLTSNIDTDELNDYLQNTLPDGIKYSIINDYVHATNDVLPDDDLHQFSLACLLQTNNGTVKLTSKQVYDDVLKIFNKIKEFVAKTPIESQPLPLYTHQQAKSFRDDIKKYSQIQLAENNQWLVSVENLWALLKPYQQIFLLTKPHCIEQNLRYTIQSLQITHLTSRLWSLVYLKSVKTGFACISMIDEYIRRDMNQIDNQIIDEFECFFDFVNKSCCLLDLLVRYVSIKGTQHTNELYRFTPTIIEHLEKVFYSTLAVTEIKKGLLYVSETLAADRLNDFQKKLDSYLQEIHFPSNIKSRYGLDDFITRLAPLFAKNRTVRRLSDEQIDQSISSLFHIRDESDIRKQQMQTTIDRIVSTLNELRSRANQLPLRPRNLIKRIHHILHKLKNPQLCQDNKGMIQCFLTEQAILTSLVEKVEREINHYATFHVHLPNDEGIHEITDKELVLADQNMIEGDYSDELKDIIENISNHSKPYDFSALEESIRVIHVHVLDQMWIHTTSLTKSSTHEHVRNSLLLLNDDLAIRCGYDFSNSDSFLGDVVFAYGQYRCDVLIKETNHKMLSNYEAIARLVTEIQDWRTKAHLNAFSLLENIKKISDYLNQIENELKNYKSANINFNLLPIETRPEDLLCIFAPEYPTLIQSICSKINDLDKFLSNRMSTLEAIELSLTITPAATPTHGLSTYVYLNQHSTPVYLFDRQKHIHYIINSVIIFLQKLINLCIDVGQSKSHALKTSTSYKELFPVHISLSLAMMIIVTWSADYLKDFQSPSQLLTIVTLKEEVKKLRDLEKKIEEQQNQLNDCEKNLRNTIDKEHSMRYQRLESTDKLSKRKKMLEEKIKQLQSSIDDLQDDLNRLSNNYERQLREQKEECMKNIIECFDLIFNSVRTFIANIVRPDQSVASQTPDQCLSHIVSFVQKEFFEPNKSKLDLTKISKAEQTINNLLEKLGGYAKCLSEEDPLFYYVRFYCDIFRISFCSLRHASHSWIIYKEKVESLEVTTYLSVHNKRILCDLKESIRHQCVEFISKIRTGDDRTEIMKMAQIISQNVHGEIQKIKTLLTGQQFSEQVQEFTDESERFIINLLIIGCRYLQLQHETYEPLDDILNGITVEVIDQHLPRKELELLQLLDMCEMQLETHCDTLVLQTFHLAFGFNSNPSYLFNRLDRSTKVLTELILPTAHMIQRMWLTITEFINKTNSIMTENEYKKLSDVCTDFLQLTEESYEIQLEYELIALRLESSLFANISQHIDQLCEILVQARPEIKKFCENIIHRWNATLQRILLGFTEAKRYELLSYKKRSRGDNTPHLADMESILKNNAIDIDHINFNNVKERNDRPRCLETLYHLTMNSIDNLGLSLMNIPTRYIDYEASSLLTNVIKKFYDESKQCLFLQPLSEYFDNTQRIQQLFNSLETIHRPELKIFNNQFTLSKNHLKELQQNFCKSADLKLSVENALRLVKEWQQAGNNFILVRKMKWLQEKTLSKSAKNKFAHLRDILSPDYYNKRFHNLKEKIRKRMQFEQVGNENICTLAMSQCLVDKIVELHKEYEASFNLQPLNITETFLAAPKVFVVDIEHNRIDPSREYFLNIWSSDNGEPAVSIPFKIADQVKKLYLVVNTQIEKLSVDSRKSGGYPLAWKKMTDDFQVYNFDQIQMRCYLMNQNNTLYTVCGFGDGIYEKNILSKEEIKDLIASLRKTLNRHLAQKKEQSVWEKSPITTSLQSIVENLRRIEQLFQFTTISDNDLLTSSEIYSAYQKLPSFDIFGQVVNLLYINNSFSPSIPIPLKVVDDKSPTTELQVNQVWTKSMEKAYQSFGNVLKHVHKRVFNTFYYLRCIKAKAILCYALDHARLANLNQETEQEFEYMTKDFEELNKHFIGDQIEAVKHAEECQRIINEATQIYRTSKRLGTIMNDMVNFERENWSIETNMNEAFRDSQMDHDVHLWLITDNVSNLFKCLPDPAILDFGINHRGIYQRLTQYIFIHNHSEKDLIVRIQRSVAKDNIFSVMEESMSVNKNTMGEFEVLSRPPSNIGIIEEEWDLIIDGNIRLQNTIKVVIRIVEVDVELSSDTIDFGKVPCGAHRILEKIYLNNVLNCPLKIKAQCQSPATSSHRSKLTIVDKELDLAEYSTFPFTVALETCDNLEEDIEADVLLAVGTRKNLKWIKVQASVKRTHLKILYENCLVIDDELSGHLKIDDLYPGETRPLSLELDNDGVVEYTLHLTSEDEELVIHDTLIKLSAQTKKAVKIKVNMPNEISRKTFNINIQFVFRRTLRSIEENLYKHQKVSYIHFQS
ncbi:unnamed protein product [Rotaria sp. Silwood1]|nr:unnamed protein product [Rotaria sp. Silwood1]